MRIFFVYWTQEVFNCLVAYECHGMQLICNLYQQLIYELPFRFNRGWWGAGCGGLVDSRENHHRHHKHHYPLSLLLLLLLFFVTTLIAAPFMNSEKLHSPISLYQPVSCGRHSGTAVTWSPLSLTSSAASRIIRAFLFSSSMTPLITHTTRLLPSMSFYH